MHESHAGIDLGGAHLGEAALHGEWVAATRHDSAVGGDAEMERHGRILHVDGGCDLIERF